MKWMIFLTVLVIALDILTGIVKGLKEKKFNSKKLRQGGLNKIAEIIAICLGAVVDKALPLFEVKIDFEVLTLVCSYLFFMECTSIIENIGKINPTIIPEKLKKFFEKL